MSKAEMEVELACKRENPDWDGKSFDYGCSCYQSALKAYNSLCDDGHSGASFSLTKNILIRLMNDLPLTPLTGNDDEWVSVSKKDESEMFQNYRMSSLFKTVYKDGRVEYNDVDRVKCHEMLDARFGFSNGLATKIINKLYPITFPYNPPIKQYEVTTDSFIAEGYENDKTDWNTRAVLQVVTPDGQIVPLNYYFADKDDSVVEITHSEYDERLKHRKNAEGPEEV